MFVDASALVAILTREPEAAELTSRLLSGDRRTTSGLAVWEAAVAIARVRKASVESAASDVHDLLRGTQIEVVPIGAEEAALALAAHARFGKGRHPARLNMGDCFAYACALRHGAPLLYKGDDFALTDVPSG